MHNSFLARNPILYRSLSRFRKSINYEKLLYLRKIKKGHTVLDIGANQGYYTSLFSILTGNKGQVHAFEPVPESFSKLEKLKKLNIPIKMVYDENDIMNFETLTEFESKGDSVWTLIRKNILENQKFYSSLNSSNMQVFNISRY